MNPFLTTFDAVGGPQPWKVLEPEAGGFDLTVTELPWLDDLIGLADAGADQADGVLNAPAWDGGFHEQTNKGQGAIYPAIGVLLSKPAAATDGQIRAGGMSHHEIPALAQQLLNRALQMPCGVSFTGEQITAPCVVAVKAKGITDPAAVFTGNQDTHG